MTAYTAFTRSALTGAGPQPKTTVGRPGGANGDTNYTLLVETRACAPAQAIISDTCRASPTGRLALLPAARPRMTRHFGNDLAGTLICIAGCCWSWQHRSPSRHRQPGRLRRRRGVVERTAETRPQEVEAAYAANRLIPATSPGTDGQAAARSTGVDTRRSTGDAQRRLQPCRSAARRPHRGCPGWRADSDSCPRRTPAASVATAGDLSDAATGRFTMPG
jgi:hypothetical protein